MLRVLLLSILFLAAPVWAGEVRELDWPALIPEGAPVIPPQLAPLHDMSQLSDALSAESAPPARQQAPDAPVVKSLDSQQVKIPGYIVPLEVSEEGRTTEFLLVPYYGACIHVPPPPTNQVIYVSYPKGAPVDDLWDAIWVKGKMRTISSSHEMATASYSMEGVEVSVYEE
jgi:hypothetical protein